jgi:hypothetical protein
MHTFDQQKAHNDHLPRSSSAGCWTGLVADMNALNALAKKTVPVSYLEQYPKYRARALNTWLMCFGLYSHGTFLELDRRGSAMVKKLILQSNRQQGFVIRVSGTRKGNKIAAQSAVEIVTQSAAEFLEANAEQAANLRRQFAVMGI